MRIIFGNGPLKGTKIECEEHLPQIDVPLMMKNAKTYYATYVDSMLKVLTIGKEDLFIYKLKTI